MPTLALRGSITSVPKWTVDIKEKRRGFVKTASCIFQVTDSVRVTCFVTDLSILTLLKNANVSPGMSVFVAGAMSQNTYIGDDGLAYATLKINVERMEYEPNVVTNLQQPITKLIACRGDPISTVFEDIYLYIKSNENLKLTAKTDLIKVRKHLMKEKVVKEKKLAQKNDEDISMSSDKEDTWLIEAAKKRKMEEDQRKKSSQQTNEKASSSCKRPQPDSSSDSGSDSSSDTD